VAIDDIFSREKVMHQREIHLTSRLGPDKRAPYHAHKGLSLVVPPSSPMLNSTNLVIVIIRVSLT